jgi:hypothetical protein
MEGLIWNISDSFMIKPSKHLETTLRIGMALRAEPVFGFIYD